MSERTFDRETLLDLTVNVVPLGIILFFVVVFLLVRPWEFDPLITVVSMVLLVVPFFALAALTFLSGRAIAQAEGEESASAIDDSFDDTDDGSDETRASAPVTAGVTDEAADDGTDDSGATDDATDTDELTDTADSDGHSETDADTPDEGGDDGSDDG